MQNVPATIEDPKVVQVKVSSATVETVKNSVFRNATDSELQLYFHKCLSVGCHPLDGMIHPSVYNNKDGSRSVVFVTAIDCMRSQAEDTGKYDGQDPPEFFEGDHGDDFVHPIMARVNVYKEGIDRPFVGEARWTEFFPSLEKKQFHWRKMPYGQLAKCAEAQGLRKAFPKKLNKQYAEEEMHQAITAAGGAAGGSTKPTFDQTVQPKQTGIVQPKQTGSNVITEKQVKRIYALCKKNDVDVEKLKAWLKGSLNLDHLKDITTEHKQYEAICQSIEKIPEKINGYGATPVPGETKPAPDETKPPKTETKKEETPIVQDHDQFKVKIKELAETAGIEEIDKFIGEMLPHIESLDKVTSDQQSMVIDLFVYHSEKASKTE